MMTTDDGLGLCLLSACRMTSSPQHLPTRTAWIYIKVRMSKMIIIIACRGTLARLCYYFCPLTGQHLQRLKVLAKFRLNVKNSWFKVRVRPASVTVSLWQWGIQTLRVQPEIVDRQTGNLKSGFELLTTTWLACHCHDNNSYHYCTDHDWTLGV